MRHRSSRGPARRHVLAAALLGLGALVHATTWASDREVVASAASGTPPAAAKPAPAWQTVSGKHTGSGVVLRYAVPDKMAVGEAVTLRLQLSGVTAPDGATVEVRDRGARALLLTQHLAAGEERTIEVSYTGRSDGMQFLDVTTTQAGRLTAVSVPLRVGTGELKLKPEGQRRTMTGGEAVISLPAATPGASR